MYSTWFCSYHKFQSMLWLRSNQDHFVCWNNFALHFSLFGLSWFWDDCFIHEHLYCTPGLSLWKVATLFTNGLSRESSKPAVMIHYKILSNIVVHRCFRKYSGCIDWFVYILSHTCEGCFLIDRYPNAILSSIASSCINVLCYFRFSPIIHHSLCQIRWSESHVKLGLDDRACKSL